ncbi:MAG TPA: carbon-nitrogen hydrolase family protein [Candidatus Obscuribacterales bacterium]
MRIALAQIEVSLDKATNLNKIGHFVQEAASQGVDLLVFPEASMFGFGKPTDNLFAASEPETGPFVLTLQQLAMQYQMWIMAGMFESPPAGKRVFNTVFVVDYQGRIVGKYRKIHLFDALGGRESDRIQPGEGDTFVFQCRGISVAVMTCYDIRFPELARHLAVRGADVIVIPCAWYAGPYKDEQLEVLVRARAIENNIYTAVCVQTGPDYAGRSMIVDPMGYMLASLTETEGLLLSELKKDRVKFVQTKSPTLSNRREEVYAGWD